MFEGLDTALAVPQAEEGTAAAPGSEPSHPARREDRGCRYDSARQAGKERGRQHRHRNSPACADRPSAGSARASTVRRSSGLTSRGIGATTTGAPASGVRRDPHCTGAPEASTDLADVASGGCVDESGGMAGRLSPDEEIV